MKKNNKKNINFWFIWLLLIIFWNFGFPNATPFYDVLVAVILSICLSLIKNLDY